MKKVIIMLATLLCLSGCIYRAPAKQDMSDFTKVPGSKNLYYNNETKVVYYIMRFNGNDYGYGFMSEYYNEDGKKCRYVENELKEIE